MKSLAIIINEELYKFYPSHICSFGRSVVLHSGLIDFALKLG